MYASPGNANWTVNRFWWVTSGHGRSVMGALFHWWWSKALGRGMEIRLFVFRQLVLTMLVASLRKALICVC